ncbi:MAG: TrkA family potassium uptake protein [Clostridia bacterium]|nr:TrkA family potassium uptake protein [Clostridia bacterium]
MKKQRKQFLVIGLGRFGSSVAKALSELGHEVLALDKQQELVDAMAPYVTEAICADSSDEDVLRSVEPSVFDAAVVSIGQDTRGSILITVLCKEMGCPYVIAKAQDDLHGKVLTKVGADKVVYPERDMGQRLARSLSMNHFIDMMELADNFEMVECAVPDEWEGRSILELNIRRNYGISIVAIKRGSKLIPSPTAEEMFSADDVLLMLGETDKISKIIGR